MHKTAFWVLLVMFLGLNPIGCGEKISPQEAKVLVALGEVQRGVETNIDYEQFVQLLKRFQPPEAF